MTNIKRVRWTVAVAAVAFGLAMAASGQADQPAAPARTQMDELLTEVRAIRADLDRAATASMRGQLLGMRLQLQEQRITALARQLSDVQERLRANTQARSALLGSMKMFEGMKEGAADKMEELNLVFAPLKQQLAALDKTDVELKAEESLLAGQLHDEQSRWSAFNGQIEAMERAAASKTIR